MFNVHVDDVMRGGGGSYYTCCVIYTGRGCWNGIDAGVVAWRLLLFTVLSWADDTKVNVIVFLDMQSLSDGTVAGVPPQPKCTQGHRDTPKMYNFWKRENVEKWRNKKSEKELKTFRFISVCVCRCRCVCALPTRQQRNRMKQFCCFRIFAFSSHADSKRAAVGEGNKSGERDVRHIPHHIKW